MLQKLLESAEAVLNVVQAQSQGIAFRITLYGLDCPLTLQVLEALTLTLAFKAA